MIDTNLLIPWLVAAALIIAAILLLSGLALGAMVALLFAPSSGAETRTSLKGRWETIKSRVARRGSRTDG